MVSYFKQGSDYTDVWYGEYAILDTRNKNDIDNGKIYRRGLDYQNVDTGGAQYVGQIVGPSSGTPYFQINTLENVYNEAKNPLTNDVSWKRYPTGLDQNGKYIISEDGNGLDIGTFQFDNTNALVPGKSGSTYHDAIRYTWVNIRNDEEGADSWFYVGFEIPYLVIDYDIHSVSPYNSLGNRVDKATISRIDDKKHPYWENWDLGVPKGIKGDTLRNLRIITPTANDTIYAWSAISTTVNSSGNYVTTLGQSGYPGMQDDITNSRKIVVFDYSFYDETSTGTTVTVYVGDYNLIKAIYLDDDGTLRLAMTHDNQYVFEKKIRWIDFIELTNGDGKAGGHFTFVYNNDNPRETDEYDVSWIKGIEVEENGSLIYTYAGTPVLSVNNLPADLDKNGRTVTRIAEGRYRVQDFIQWLHAVELNPDTGTFTVTNNRDQTIFTTTLDWIKNIVLDPDGTIHFWHTKDNRDEQHANAIKWVNSVSLNAATGVFQMNFNYGNPLTVQMDWIDKVYINEENGEISVHHVHDAQNDSTVNSLGQRAEVLDAKLKLIVSARISSDGILSFVTNTGDVIQLNDADSNQVFKITNIEDIRLNKGITEDKHIQIKYNTENDWVKIGDPINYIQDMVVRTNDWHLLVLYNDPAHRVTATDLNESGRDTDGNLWVSNITGSDGTEYGNNIYWRDYGTIKDQAGILVGFNVTREELEGTEYEDDIEAYLNATFPNGLTGENNQPGGISTMGKIITYQPGSRDNVEFYAFDYNTYKWFFLGKIQDDEMRDARLYNESEGNETTKQEIIKFIHTNGLLFTAKKIEYSTDSIPKFWKREYNGWN